MCIESCLCRGSWPLNHNCSRCPAWTPASQAGSSGRSQRWRMRNTWRGRRRRSCSRESSSSSIDQCRSHCCSDCSLSWHWWGYCKWTHRKGQRLMTWHQKGRTTLNCGNRERSNCLLPAYVEALTWGRHPTLVFVIHPYLLVSSPLSYYYLVQSIQSTILAHDVITKTSPGPFKVSV